MSHVYSWSSVSRTQGRTQARVGRRAISRETADIATVSAFSGLPESIDFFIWAFLAVAVLPQTVFAAAGPTTSLLAGLALWAIAYPVRGIAFRFFLSGHGPSPVVRLIGARMLLALSTAAIAFVPGAGHGVVAVSMLAILRIGQGVGMGGLIHPEPTTNNREARAMGWVFSTLMGLAAAVALSAALGLSVSWHDYLDWGWRYPFVLALPLNVVALFTDLRSAVMSSERRGLKLVASA
jgi:MFS family permease